MVFRLLDAQGLEELLLRQSAGDDYLAAGAGFWEISTAMRLAMRLSRVRGSWLLSLVVLRQMLSTAQGAYDAAEDAHITAEQDATFLTFAEGTSEVSVTFEAGGNTYSGVLNTSTPISLSAFQTLGQATLTDDPDNPVAPEAVADVFETITSVTFTTVSKTDFNTYDDKN